MKLHAEELTLYLQCMNEVLHGFKTAEFERIFLVSEATLAKEYARLQTLKGIEDIPLRSEVIQKTVEELGTEFQTRTGYHLSKAEKLLKKIQAN